MPAAPGSGPSDDPDDDRGVPPALDHFERPKWGARSAGLGLLGALGLLALYLPPYHLWAPSSLGLQGQLPAGNATGVRRLSELDALADLRRMEGGDTGTYKTAYVSLAAYPYMCLDFPSKLETGTLVTVKSCPEDRSRAAKFLVPVGVVGPLRPAAAPHLCLDSPKGFDLQLWSCEEVRLRYDIERIRFLLRPEAPTWLKYENFDVANGQDAEQMSADDLVEVMHRVEEKGYSGFSVWHGQAWIKNVPDLTKDNMNFNGNGVEFYMYRPRGDFTIRAATDPGLCVGAPTRIPVDGEVLRLMPCGLPRMYALLLKTRFILHYAMLNEAETERLQHVIDRHRRREFTTTTQQGQSPPTITTTEPPKAHSEAKEDVRVSMTITNVDYDLFMSHTRLKGEVGDVIRQEVAKAAGHTVTPDCVSLRFSQGSVKVDSTIHVPEGTPEDSVIAKMKTSQTALKAAVADRITELPDIGEVTLGAVGVEEDTPEPFYASPLRWLRSHLSWNPSWPHWPNWHPLSGVKLHSGLWPWIVGGFVGGGLVALCVILACLQRTQLRSLFESRSARSTAEKTSAPPAGTSTALSIFQTRTPKVDIAVPGVWRLGRITDRARPNNTSYDVDLDSTGGGRMATRALEYSPVIGGW